MKKQHTEYWRTLIIEIRNFKASERHQEFYCREFFPLEFFEYGRRCGDPFGVIADERHLPDRTHTLIFIERSMPDQLGWQSSPCFSLGF
jgi:hypothetical protein